MAIIFNSAGLYFAGGENIPDEYIRMAKRGSRLSMVAISSTQKPVLLARLVSAEAIIMGSVAYEHEDIV
ncbi:MAG: hypothetical protein LBQ57_13665 [Spirochaetales bacterium]|nr:hypothetical protein [Spirochaetales bacterium]